MESLLLFSILVVIIVEISQTNGQRIKYISDLLEGQNCEYNLKMTGVCTKLEDCSSEFFRFQTNQSELIICGNGDTLHESLICCPKNKAFFINKSRRKKRTFSKPALNEIFNFEACSKIFFEYRKHTLSLIHLAEAMSKGRVLTNLDSCSYLEKLGYILFDKKSDLAPYFKCSVNEDGTLYVNASNIPKPFKDKGTQIPYMAAIGWTQSDRTIQYKCGGTIISDRFIISAAHCKYSNRIQADIVHVGDRYLLSSQDDDIAQQLKIEKFISHPSYSSRYKYNDIAIIRTKSRIIFSQFVNPACIDDLSSNDFGQASDLSIAGYGLKPDSIPTHTLRSSNIYLVPNSECNKTYEDDSSLPFGIMDSQFCVIGQSYNEISRDTCFSDSGSPSLRRSSLEIKHSDYEKSFLSSNFETSTVLGIVSFGMSCEVDAPSVHTKISYYKPWLRSIMENYIIKKTDY